MSDKRIDQYIDNSKPFARPILQHIRKLIHLACPDVEERIKWSFPHFCYKGILCSMASFQSHCAFGFWKSALMADPLKLMGKPDGKAMGNFGRLTDSSELPSDEVMIAYIHEAMRLNDSDIKVDKPKSERKELIVPDYFMAELKKNKKALETFENFTYSKKKDYLEWLIEAKQEATRQKRLETTIEQLSEGKSRNWKYENC